MAKSTERLKSDLVVLKDQLADKRAHLARLNERHTETKQRLDGIKTSMGVAQQQLEKKATQIEVTETAIRQATA